ncbi:MAG: hypothetical protein ACI9VN_002958 [Patescibacteria group bacterium]|jgi:hypothetical protein
MNKNILLLLAFLAFSSALFAQDSLRQQAIQLIDGSILKAQILEESDDYTRIKIISGDVLLLNNELIKSIGDVAIANIEKLPRRSALQHKGNYNIFSLGLLAGRDAQLEQGLIIGSSVISFIKGYQINQYLGIGAGIGFDIYDERYLPIHLDFRGNFNVMKATLYYTLQAGYSFSDHDFGSDDDTQISGGLLVYPAVGIKIPTTSKLDVLVEFGYRSQRAKRDYTWSENTDEITYQRYAFKVGLAF